MTYITIGERIKNRRTELGLTQEELAIRLGYTSRSAITNIEKGTRQLRQSQIVAMANALETTIDYIMGWENEPENESLVLNEEELSIIKRYIAADNRTRHMVKTILSYGEAMRDEHEQ